LPFLTIACPKFHTEYLTNLGFKLYDEIFDYSFDLEENIDVKIELLLKNVQMTLTADLDGLYQKIRPKIEHNHTLIQRILVDNSFIPSIAMRRMDNNLSPHEMFKNHMENRYD
jgi:hypothetical protein